LRNERPDVEEKRLNLLKLQGEYVVKLRELEDSLLDALVIGYFYFRVNLQETSWIMNKLLILWKL
jgi:hypothetical protein